MKGTARCGTIGEARAEDLDPHRCLEPKKLPDAKALGHPWSPGLLCMSQDGALGAPPCILFRGVLGS